MEHLTLITLDGGRIAELFDAIKTFVQNKIVPPTTNGDLPKKIFVRRSSGLFYNLSWRKPINYRLLEFFAVKKGYALIDPAELSLSELISLFSSSVKIVSYSGGGLSNILFCREGTQIVELYSEWFNDCFQILSKQCQLNYRGYSYRMFQFKHPKALITRFVNKESAYYNFRLWYVPIRSFSKIFS